MTLSAAIQRLVGRFVPGEDATITFSLGFLAFVVVAIVGMNFASLWFFNSEVRSCAAMRFLVNDAALRLEAVPGATLDCSQARAILAASPPRLVQNMPALASRFGTFKLADEFARFATGVVAEKCAQGRITRGELAAALREEMLQRCP